MNLYPEQKKFVQSDSDRVAFIGGRQSGKTTALCWKVVDDVESGRDVSIVLHNSGYADMVRTEMINALSGPFIVQTKDKISLQHGGSVKITSSLKDARGAEVLALDEPQLFQTSAHDILRLKVPIYAVGTSKELSVFDDVYVASSFDNPAIDPSFDNFLGPEESVPYRRINGHKVIDGECLRCGQSALSKEGELVTLYNIGMFLHTPCQ